MSDQTPRFCATDHSMIQWFDPAIMACPLCAVVADLKEVSAEAERLAAENEAAAFDERTGDAR